MLQDVTHAEVGSTCGEGGVGGANAELVCARKRSHSSLTHIQVIFRLWIPWTFVSVDGMLSWRATLAEINPFRPAGEVAPTEPKCSALGF